MPLEQPDARLKAVEQQDGQQGAQGTAGCSQDVDQPQCTGRGGAGEGAVRLAGQAAATERRPDGCGDAVLDPRLQVRENRLLLEGQDDLELGSIPAPPHRQDQLPVEVHQLLAPPGGGNSELQVEAVSTAGQGDVRRSEHSVGQWVEPGRQAPGRGVVMVVVHGSDPGPLVLQGVLEVQAQVAGLTSFQLLAGGHWPPPPAPVGLHGEAAARRSANTRLEVKRVLHVEGSDGHVGGRWEGHAGRQVQRQEKRPAAHLLSLEATGAAAATVTDTSWEEEEPEMFREL